MRVLAWPKNNNTNPYTSLLYSNMAPGISVEGISARTLFGQYSVCHVHWPEASLNIRNSVAAARKLARLFVVIDYLRWRGTRIVWTIHNLKAHESFHPSLEVHFWRRFIPRVDGAISLSDSGLSLARATFPPLQHVPMSVIPHGHYRDSVPINTMKSRESFGIRQDAKVILFFGAIRAYKNIEGLVRVFRQVSTPGALLLVVGRPDVEALNEAIVKEASADSRVRVVIEFVKNDDVSSYMRAADLVVLPYRDVLNSGSALLALSFSRPVLVPDLGAMGELANDFGGEWVRTFRENLDAKTLEDALDWSVHLRSSECLMPDKYNWQSIRIETAQLYEKVLSGERGMTSGTRDFVGELVHRVAKCDEPRRDTPNTIGR